MRTRGWALVQEAMGAEAAATVSEAGSLARRHGHARVTPLHVASAILSSSSTQAAGGLLWWCGHPLRHEDLMVSFNDALSRLPVACPAGADPLDLSNALVALLRRAQTLQHQGSAARGGRRGRRRRRKVATVKIELEQLVASVLDDPSVHRAMRRAASGSQVKPNVVEQSNQASAGTVREVLHWPVAADDTCPSWDHASLPRTREGLPALVGQCGVTTERTSLPCHQDEILTCRNTSFQPKFAELCATNFKIMCEALELRVPRHHDIIPDIASTVLLCRSGMMKRARSLMSTTWLLFQGNDYYGKKAMAQELSKLIFGSYTDFFLISVDPGNLALKTEISEQSDKMFVMRTFLEAIRENPHRVVFIDGINQLDYESEIETNNLIATGRIVGCNGSDMVNLDDAIVVLSSGSGEASHSKTFAFSPMVNRGITSTQNGKEDTAKEKELEPRHFSFDLNACTEHVEDNTVDNNAGIMSFVDGVFRFD